MEKSLPIGIFVKAASIAKALLSVVKRHYDKLKSNVCLNIHKHKDVLQS